MFVWCCIDVILVDVVLVDGFDDVVFEVVVEWIVMVFSKVGYVVIIMWVGGLIYGV